MRISALALLGLVFGLWAVWCLIALSVDMRPAWLRWPALGLFLVGLGVALWMGGTVWRKLAGALGLMMLVLAWWFCLQPSNDRPWRPEVTTLPWAEIAGDSVTLHNIRNCEYRTETDFDVRHYDRTFDLRQLKSVDFMLVNWGVPLISHTMVSFGFSDGQQVCISIETRMERGESYSALKGFFRQFELTYVIADERDVVRLRTNHRQGEEVFLYRVRMKPERMRALFLDYLRRANSLHERPEWYNALTSNCTTNIRLHGEAVSGRHSPFDWRFLLNGEIDRMLYERRGFASELPFTELKQRSRINAAAHAAGAAPAFSERIRDGLPGIGLAP